MSEHTVDCYPTLSVTAQDGTCPRCGSKRTNDGHCSTCFLRRLPR